VAAGAIDTVTIGQVDLSSAGAYVFHAFTSFPGEQNAANDSVNLTVNVKAQNSTFPFVENFETGNLYSLFPVQL